MLMDTYAWYNPLRAWHPAEKFLLSLSGFVACLISNVPATNLLVFGFYAGLTVFKAKVPWRAYLRMLLWPGFFLVAGIMTILISCHPDLPCLFTWSFGSLSFGIARDSLHRCGLLLSRACGMVGAMYFLCLTTPVVELTAVLRSARMPEIAGDVMYLMYRCIHLLTAEAEEIRRAQALRLGYRGWKCSLRSTALLVAATLNHGLRHSHEASVAMIVRGPACNIPDFPLFQPLSKRRILSICTFALLILLL